MRGVPDHNQERPCVSMPSLIPAAITLTPRDRIPEPLAELGQEVLEMVPRKLRGSLVAYRRVAIDLSLILRINGVRVKPRSLYYAALRLKWIRDNMTSIPCRP